MNKFVSELDETEINLKRSNAVFFNIRNADEKLLGELEEKIEIFLELYVDLLNNQTGWIVFDKPSYAMSFYQMLVNSDETKIDAYTKLYKNGKLIDEYDFRNKEE